MNFLKLFELFAKQLAWTLFCNDLLILPWTNDLQFWLEIHQADQILRPTNIEQLLNLNNLFRIDKGNFSKCVQLNSSSSLSFSKLTIIAVR